MKVSELIKNLQDELEKHGDLPVAVYADHGQDQMICCGAGKQLLEDFPDKEVIEIYGEGYFYFKGDE